MKRLAILALILLAGCVTPEWQRVRRYGGGFGSAQGTGAGGVLTTGDLAEVLTIGAVTGGTSLTVSTGDSILGAAELTLVSTTTGAASLDSGTTGAVNVGVGASAKVVTIGNSTGATSVVINAGTGDISIGSTGFARTVVLGTGSANQQVTVGSTSSTSKLSLDSATGGSFLNSAGGSVWVGNGTAATDVRIGNASLTSGNMEIVGVDVEINASLNGGGDGALKVASVAAPAGLTLDAVTTVTITSGTTDDAASFLSGNNGAGDSGDVTVGPGTASGTVGTLILDPNAGGATLGGTLGVTGTSTMATVNATRFALGSGQGLLMGVSGNFRMEFDNAQTVDSTAFFVDNVSRTVIFSELADRGTDWGASAATNPTLRIQSADATSVTDAIEFFHDQAESVVNSVGGNLALKVAGTTIVQVRANDVAFARRPFLPDNVPIAFGTGTDAWIEGDGTAGLLRVGITESTSSGTLSAAAFGARAEGTDTLAVPLVLTSMDAYSQSTGGQEVGAPLILAGGIGRRLTEVIDFNQTLYDVVVTVSVAGVTTVNTLTEGTDWTNITDEATSAGLLATVIDGLSGVSAVAVGAVIHVQADASTHSLLLAETGTGNTVTNSLDGSVVADSGLKTDSIDSIGSTLEIQAASGTTLNIRTSAGTKAFAITNGANVVSLAMQHNTTIRMNDVALIFGLGNDAFLIGDGSTALLTLGSTSTGVDGAFRTFDIQAGATAEGAFLSIKSNSELLATTSGATVVTTGLVPAGARILYVVARVTTQVTTSSAGDTFDIGIGGGDVDVYGADIAGALNTTVDSGDATADPMSFSTSGQEVTLDATAAETFTAGAVRVTAFYLEPTAPGS